MKISVYFCYITVFFSISTSSTSAYPKSSNDNKFILSKDNDAKLYPVKRKVANPEPPSFIAAHEEESDLASPSISQPRYRRVENNYDRKSKASLEKELDLKRTSLLSGLGKRADRLYKRDLRPQRREEAYGIVYGNGRPIGILEPFPQAYELSPMYSSREGIEEIEPVPQVNPRSVMDMLYSDRLASRGDWENNENSAQEPVKYTNDKYPSVMNDYKVTNRLNNNGMSYKHTNNEQERIKSSNQIPAATKRDAIENQKKESSDLAQKDPVLESDNLDDPNKASDVKRSTSGITNEKIDVLKSALNRMQNPGPSDKVEEIEDNLRDILSDMGLIEGEYNGEDSFKNKRDNSAKRDADKEDENLEEGLNKIELVKAAHEAPAVERNKREDKKETNSKDVDKAKTDTVPEASLNKDQEVANSNKAEQIKIAEDASQLKSEPSLKSDLNVAGEIKMGDPKINVANYQSEGDAYIRSKRQEGNDIMKGLEKSGDLTVSGNKSPLACSGNEAEMEKKRNKDQTSTAASTANKAKREQDDLEYQKQIEENIQAKIDAIKEQVKREIEALKTRSSQEQQRQKRDVNTLLAEESSALDPQKHPDEKLVPHIRRRRNLEDLQNLTRAKRGLPDFSNLKNIDSGDYLDLMGEQQRNQRETIKDYVVDPQENKFLAEVVPNSIGDTSETKRSSNIQEGLPAAETVNLNVNDQDDSSLQNDNTNIRERSVDNPFPNGSLMEKKSTSAQIAEKELKQSDSASLSQREKKFSQNNKNEAQSNVGSNLQETKTDDDTLVQKQGEEQANVVSSLEKSNSDDDTLVAKPNEEQANVVSSLQETKSDDDTLVQKPNEEQANVVSNLQETKSDDDTLVQKPNEEQANVVSSLQEPKSDDDTLVQKQNEEQANVVSSLQETKSDDDTLVQKPNEEQANVVSSLQEPKSDDDTLVQKPNEEQVNVVSSLQETKADYDTLVQKRSTDSHILPKENSGQKEVNSKNKEQTEGKKREVEDAAKINNPKDQKSKRDVTISVKSDDASSLKVTEKPTLYQKQKPKRSIADVSLDLKPSIQPEKKDLQETANSRRLRRQVEEEVMQNPSMVYGRRKRANAIMPYAKSSFFPYRAEEEDGDDEGDEFEEDSFDDRSNLQKREAGYNSRYNNQFRRSLDYQQDYGDYSNNYQPVQKRSLASRYVANENSDVYENPYNYLYHPVNYVRQKRQNFDQLASLHGGGPMLHHLAAVRERSMQQLDNDNNRNKRTFNKNGQNFDNQNKEEPENIADLSAADLFGALPQSYDGNNLLRFKRVKREVPSSSTEETRSTRQ